MLVTLPVNIEEIRRFLAAVEAARDSLVATTDQWHDITIGATGNNQDGYHLRAIFTPTTVG